ncbi:MAG TPA: hypothetical protein VIL30_06800 [Ramlibacter sp.]|jgi:hypothetical protein
MMSEARKITAQYLNGLAVAILASVGGACLTDRAPLTLVVVAAVCSLIVHLFAVRLVRGE